jgi:hypothetical protein
VAVVMVVVMIARMRVRLSLMGMFVGVLAALVGLALVRMVMMTSS